MIGNNKLFDAFVSDHRWAVLTSLRKDGRPVSSLVAYAREGDQLVVSTPGATFKRLTIERDARVNMCVLSSSEPFNYVSIEAEAAIETDHLVESTRRILVKTADSGYEQPDDLEVWLKQQARVILRISPQRVSGVIR